MKKVLSVILGIVVLVAAFTLSFKIPQIIDSRNDKMLQEALSISDERNDIDNGQGTHESATEKMTSPQTTRESATEKKTSPQTTRESATSKTTSPQTTVIDKNGSFFSKDEVALYIHTYGRLPGNFITKSQAENLGWSGGTVEKYAPGKAIGGDIFYNREKQLPTASGRTYYECDIDTLGASSRGAKRIVFSNDGLVYYTDDHYETFTRLYNGD